jgi:hypothetical protein
MSTVITAGNATNGLSLSADNAGAFEFKTGTGAGTTALTLSSAQVATFAGAASVPGNLSFNSGYGSSAVAYGCRAWVNFNGQGTVAIRASGNVTSISDVGTGDYYVNYTTNMPDGNYSVVGTVSSSGGGVYILCVDVPAAYEVSRVRVAITNGSATVSDRSIVNVAIFR